MCERALCLQTKLTPSASCTYFVKVDKSARCTYLVKLDEVGVVHLALVGRVAALLHEGSGVAGHRRVVLAVAELVHDGVEFAHQVGVAKDAREKRWNSMRETKTRVVGA